MTSEQVNCSDKPQLTVVIIIMNFELSIMNSVKSSLFVFIFVKYLIYDKYCLRVICYLCIKNLQKNGWECEKAWITFEHLFDIGTYIFNIETYIS